MEYSAGLKIILVTGVKKNSKLYFRRIHEIRDSQDCLGSEYLSSKGRISCL